jgi:hypothetical protein
MSKGYNVDLMIDVRNYLKEHPEEHNQSHWYKETYCGTRMCIAGTAVFLAEGHEVAKWRAVTSDLSQHTTCVARRLLGLNLSETRYLFHTMVNKNALDVLDEFIEAGKNGERIILPYSLDPEWY